MIALLLASIYVLGIAPMHVLLSQRPSVATTPWHAFCGSVLWPLPALGILLALTFEALGLAP